MGCEIPTAFVATDGGRLTRRGPSEPQSRRPERVVWTGCLTALRPTLRSNWKDGHGHAALDRGIDTICREDEALESLRCGRGCDGGFYYVKSIRTGLLGSVRYCFFHQRRIRISNYTLECVQLSTPLEFPYVSVRQPKSVSQVIGKYPCSRIHKGTDRNVVGWKGPNT